MTRQGSYVRISVHKLNFTVSDLLLNFPVASDKNFKKTAFIFVSLIF